MIFIQPCALKDKGARMCNILFVQNGAKVCPMKCYKC